MSSEYIQQTSLMEAVRKPNNIDKILEIMTSGDDINQVIDEPEEGQAQLSNAELGFKKLFEKHRIKKIKKKGFTALMAALQVPDNLVNVEFLLKHGAEISIVAKNGQNILDYAAETPNNKAVLLYLKDWLTKFPNNTFFREVVYRWVREPNKTDSLQQLLETFGEQHFLKLEKEEPVTPLVFAATIPGNINNVKLITKFLEKQFSHEFPDSEEMRKKLMLTSLLNALKSAGTIQNNSQIVNFLIDSIQQLGIDPKLTLLDVVQIPNNEIILGVLFKQLNDLEVNQEIDKLIIAAAKVPNNTKNLNFLLTKKGRNPNNFLMAALVAVTVPENINNIDFLMQEVVNISDRNAVLTAAVTSVTNPEGRFRPNDDNIRFLLDSKKLDPSVALIAGVKETGNDNHVKILLDHPSIDKKTLRMALLQAIQTRDNSINIQALIEKGLLDTHDIEEAILVASQVPNTEKNIEICLNLNQPKLSADVLAKALMRAVTVPNNEATIQLFLDSGKLDQSIIDKSLLEAAKINENTNLFILLRYSKAGSYQAVFKQDKKSETNNTEFLRSNFLYFSKKPEKLSIPWYKYLTWPLSKLTSYITLPAQVFLSSKATKKQIDKEYQQAIQEYQSKNEDKRKQLRFKRLKVITHDGAELDTTEISVPEQDPNKPKKPIEDQKYVIQVLGNGEAHGRKMEEMIRDATRLGCNVIGFDYRGVLDSQGSPWIKEKLMFDVLAQVQRLLDQGVKPENITLKGHSLGAGIASLVAKYLHDQNKKVYLFNGRSFSKTSAVVGGGRFMAGLLRLIGWEIDAFSAYRAIPSTHKDYIITRAPGSVIHNIAGEQSKVKESLLFEDGVIPYHASLHKALSGDRQKEQRAVDELLDKEGIKLTSEQRSMIKTARKMRVNHDSPEYSDYIKPLPHNVPLGALLDSSGQNAEEYFYRFVENQGKPKTAASLHPLVAQIIEERERGRGQKQEHEQKQEQEQEQEQEQDQALEHKAAVEVGRQPKESPSEKDQKVRASLVDTVAGEALVTGYKEYRKDQRGSGEKPGEKQKGKHGHPEKPKHKRPRPPI